VKLLLDENLSHRILPRILDRYPDSSHVNDHGLQQADDEAVWVFAAQNGFTIVSKDADFHQRSLVRGHPPKFIYLRLGNCSTQRIVDILRDQYDVIQEFGRRAHEALLVLTW
jgi:predicted nuclease of predicted toxin-antitoxin system